MIPEDVRRRFVLGLWDTMSEDERDQVRRSAKKVRKGRWGYRETETARELLKAVEYWQSHLPGGIPVGRRDKT